MDNKALGKGLSALISSATDKARMETALEQMSQSRQKEQGMDPQNISQQEVATIRTDLIDNNPCQPRVNYDPAALEELKISIKDKGILQPILVRQKEGRFQVVAGQRRLSAARALGLESVPAVIKNVSDADCLLLALVENIQRQDLNPIEEASAFDTLIQGFKLTQDQVAQAVGKDRSTISNMLRLLTLPSDIQDYLIDGRLTMGHARALLAVSDVDQKRKMVQDIINQNLSVRSVEGLTKQTSGKKPKKTKAQRAKDPDIANLEDELRKILGTKVTVEDKKGKGKLIVEYYSLDDLDRVLAVIRKDNSSGR